MKRILKIIYVSLFVLILPVTLALGQDRKSEQKIKVIVDEGAGTKVLIDTVIKDSPKTDSLTLRDGSVVYLNRNKHHRDKDHFNVSYSSHGKNDAKEYKEVTVISSDSTEIENADSSKNVRYYTRSDKHEGNGGERYIIRSKDHGDKQTYYIDKSESPDKGIENSVDVYISDADNDSSMEKTKYVIAKDGMVVTVEGNDDAKAKELVKDIENKLGVTSETKVKVESKKIIKK